MKKIILYIFLICLISFVSCKKDETRVVISNEPVGSSIVTPGNMVLTKNDSANIITFRWSRANFGFNTPITYYLQVDKSGNNFKNAANILSTTNDTFATINVYNFDNILLANNFDTVAQDVELRIIALLKGIGNAFVDTVFANKAGISLTPFNIVINYPKLWVPGSYNGWADPKQALTIASVKSDEKYEGYIYFPDATTSFKLIKIAPAWDQNNTIGDPDASGTTGTLQIGNWGGNNISVSGGPGYFKINADLNAKTYKTLKTPWAVAGDFNGWGDAAMTYDIAKNIWTLTTNLTTGNIKFKINGDTSWALNYGDNAPADGKLDSAGSNIAIAADGNYTITLDFSKPIYKYKIVKN